MLTSVCGTDWTVWNRLELSGAVWNHLERLLTLWYCRVEHSIELFHIKDDLREFACVYSRHPGSSAWFLASVLRSVTPFPRESAESAGSAGSADEFPDRTFSQQYWASKIDPFGTRIAP